jgi:MULE transposase domain
VPETYPSLPCFDGYAPVTRPTRKQTWIRHWYPVYTQTEAAFITFKFIFIYARSCRLSRDALYNLHELALDIDFVHDIHTFPDLSVILYDPSILAIFKSLLSTSQTPDLPLQQLSYDTTFNLGDFYVSILLFRETEFTDNPVVPLAYLIHERKLFQTHSIFFSHMQSVIPEIGNASNVIMITDQEIAIRKAIVQAFPDLRIFLCWNHIEQVFKTTAIHNTS